MQAVKMLNALVAFLLELGMLASLGVWGYRSGNALVTKWLLAIGIPLFVGVLWGFVLAPKAPYRLDNSPRVLVETALFLLAAIALYKIGYPTLAIVFAVLSVLCQLIFLVIGEWKP
jgi:hypothetical protein